MDTQTKPMLSIGIIFKNEIRCLERCLKSLQPLRDAVACEVVMADTGSDDGSREVAEKYADILFDFPWINDFAAARNAVMDRCSGQWYLSIDADEWLDEDAEQLTASLRNGMGEKPMCALVIRNYVTADLKGDYGDFYAVRMVRMSTGIRYTGAIHEHWEMAKLDISGLARTILHHDGYVVYSAEQGKAKRDRNMRLLREKLEKNPEDLMTLLQCIESSAGTWEYEGFIRRAVAGVEKRASSWEQAGAPILRHAVNFAQSVQLPEEEEEWIELAQTLFPYSPFTTIDIAYTSFYKYAREENTEKMIAAGEGYLDAMEDYRAGHFDAAALIYSTLTMAAQTRENNLRILLANRYIQESQFVRAWEILEKIDLDRLNAGDVKNYLGDLLNLYAQGWMDMSQSVIDLWERLNRDKEDVKRRNNMLSAAGQVFPQKFREVEREKGYRHAYTVFSPLAGKWGPGTAAAILEMNDPGEMELMLAQVKNWSELPIHALAYALEMGVRFPLPDHPLNIEVMDYLAARLMKNKENIRLAGRSDNIAWNRSLALAAVRAFDWIEDEAVSGLELARTFAKTEAAFLPLCYAPESLKEDGLAVLPAVHRFGWYCIRAFEALDGDDTAGYVRRLREGLSTCESMKPMVEFLIRYTPQLQSQETSAELRSLAEKVRTILAACDSGDPAVAALKSSPAYQKVAHLIEGADGGGLPS